MNTAHVPGYPPNPTRKVLHLEIPGLGTAEDTLLLLAEAKCKHCNGTGDKIVRSGDSLNYNTMECPHCDGNGWNESALDEFCTKAA